MKKKYDLVLVGSGFASIFFLKKYLQKAANTVKVLIIERGEMLSHKSRMNMYRESSAFYTENHPNNTFIAENPDKMWVYEPNFGGGSNCWTGCTPRFLPNDFKLKSRYGVGQDWPLTYEDLAPYYDEAEEIMSIAGPDGTPFPRSSPYPLPAQPLSTFDELMQNKFPGSFISQPTARPTRAVNGRSSCCTSAVCRLCPVDSKFTIMNTLNDVYTDSRVEIRYKSQVLSLITENNVVKGLNYLQDNKELKVEAEVIALGANAIFNAHILMNTGDENPLTGAGLTEQVGTYAYFYLDNFQNVGGGSIIPANGYLYYDGEHRKESAACMIESHNTPYLRTENGKWRHIARLKFVFEDIPDPQNKVILTDDPHVPQLIFNGHSDYVDKGYQRIKQQVEKDFSDLPIEKIIWDGYFQKTEYHICSTTRMGQNPVESVVDKFLIHHQYRNLFVLGSGAFPSIAPANPTLTLSALSLMTADNNF